MLKTYIKIAIRSLLKHKLTSLINLFGLTVALTCSFAIIAYNIYELSYDKHYANSDNIYRLTVDWKWGTERLNMANTSGPMAPLLQQNFPEVEQTVRFFAEGTEYIKSGENTIEIFPIFTETSFFEIFDHTFLQGDPKTALSAPNSMVLTESAAIKIFGSVANAYGKTMEYIDRPAQKVTGIIKDVPANSHLTFDAAGVLDAKADYVNEIQNISLYTYLTLKKGTDVPKLETKIKSLMAKKMNDPKSDHSLDLQPLTSIHLHSHLPGELGANGNIQNLYLFSLVGVVILILACINYINLTTARSSRRAREIGVRKVMGSNRRQLILQFFSEAFLLVLIALIFSLLLFHLAAPVLALLGGKELSIRSGGWKTILAIAAITAVVSLLSGLYPAVFLSKFNAVSVLQGTFKVNHSHSYLRKSLVVLQFTISVVLIAITLISWRQLNFVMNKDLGLDKDQVVGLHFANNELRTSRLSSLRNELESHPNILGTSATTIQIGLDGRMSGGGFFFEKDGQRPTKTTMSQKQGIDTEYLQMMKIKLKYGRNFYKNSPTDSAQSVIINESLARSQGWTNPLGKRVWYFTDDEGNTTEAKVIGVVKDFHVASLHKAIEPLVFFLVPPKESDNLYVKIKPENMAATLDFIKRTYKKFDSYNPYTPYFLDQNFNKQYQEDAKKKNLFLLFAGLAILIASLGLFGLTSFTIEQRTKEIGVRKVLGASVKNILVLVSKDFVWLILISLTLAIPLAWVCADKWLQDFAYRIDISWWIFGIAGLLGLAVATFTISFQVFKAASANPVKNLRTE